MEPEKEERHRVRLSQWQGAHPGTALEKDQGCEIMDGFQGLTDRAHRHEDQKEERRTLARGPEDLVEQYC